MKIKSYLIVCQIEIRETPPYDEGGMTEDEAATYIAGALQLQVGDTLKDLTAYELAPSKTTLSSDPYKP